MVETLIKRRDGKPAELAVNKRTLSKLAKPPNLKHLRYSRELPVKCDDCPYKPLDEGGNGICNFYKRDSVCTIRADIRKQVQKYSSRNPDVILPLMKEEFETNYEKLKFFETLETQELNPEVTKRINAMTNLGKVLLFTTRLVANNNTLNQRFQVIAPGHLNHIRENYRVRIINQIKGIDEFALVKSINYKYPSMQTIVQLGEHKFDSFESLQHLSLNSSNLTLNTKFRQNVNRPTLI